LPTVLASQLGSWGAAATSSPKLEDGSLRFNVFRAASAFSGPNQASAPGLSGVPIGKRQLPARRVPQLNDLLAQIHRPAAAGCQIDLPDRHLGCQAKRVGRRSAVRYDDFAALERERFDRLLD
jgi:hypothetical protein